MNTPSLSPSSSNATENSPRFGGIIPPLVTPLSERDRLDREGLHRLLEHVVAGGVSGVFILGTTGEAPSLSYRLRREMIEQTVAIIDRRIPVLVGVTDTAFVESVALARFASDRGADAAVLTTPYYFPAGQTELASYIRQLAPQIPLPLMLYNMPDLTKVWFEIETLRSLSDIDSIVGVKDSSGNLDYFRQLCGLRSERPDWSMMLGPEALLAEAHAVGGDGGVNGGANVVPQWFVSWFDALRRGDADEAAKWETLVQEFQAIYDIGKYASRHIKATKSALSLLNICSDLPADPFHRFLPPQRQRVADILNRIGIETF